MELRSRAIVLRTGNLGEADKLLTLLLPQAGKIKAVARGSRKTKSRFASLVEPLNLGHFLLKPGKTFYIFIQGELIKSYTGLKRDLEKLAYAQYFCELCEHSLPEGEPAEKIFLLLLAALENLEKDACPARVARCFELNLLEELGLRPALEACSSCGNKEGPFYFDPAGGSLLCTGCPRPHGSFPLSASALALMRRFLKRGFYKLSVCRLPGRENKEIRQVCSGLFSHALGIDRLKSLDFLQQLAVFSPPK